MANPRQLVKRRRAVRNTRKITQTMQLIATARYQKCLQRATASQPYTRAITEMIAAVSGDSSSVNHPLLAENDDANTCSLLTITANRGFCGAYNASILRVAMDHRKSLLADGRTVEVDMVGKKGVNAAKFLDVPTASEKTDIEDQIPYQDVREIADAYMRRYEAGELKKVFVAYTRFDSVSRQTPLIAQLLPIEPPETSEADAERAAATEFEFTPPPLDLLARLIPETVKIRLYQYFNDAIVSEQVSRMIAMKSATDAAGDMIKDLTRQYNRARQTQITMELLDIVGGAEAIQ